MTMSLKKNIRKAIISSGIGAIAALAVSAYRFFLFASEGALFGIDSGHLVVIAENLPPLLRASSPILGGLAAGLLLCCYHTFCKKRSHQTFSSDYLDVVRYNDGQVHISSSVAAICASFCVVATGNAIGREGAMILLAVVLTFLLARRFTPKSEWKLWAACGIAAGMSSAYHAPMMGYFFIVEVFMGTFAPLAAWPVAVAAFGAFGVTHILYGACDPLYSFAGQLTVSFKAYAAIAATGILSGVLGPFYMWSLILGKKAFQKTALPLPVKFTLGAAVGGVLSLVYPNVWGNGYTSIQELLHADMGIHFVVGMLLCKGIAICACSGSGAPGGIFTPTLFIGAASGSLLASIAASIVGDPFSPVFIVAGMATVLAAVSHAPIMAAVMICELIGDFSLLLPLLAGCLIATAVSRRIKPISIYGTD